MTMDQGAWGVGADTRRQEPDRLDAAEWAGALRRLAVDAHEILNRPDATTDELVEIRRRLKGLLRASRGSRLSEIDRWLRSADSRLDARLLWGLVADPELAVS
jgi:hypothetical protein